MFHRMAVVVAILHIIGISPARAQMVRTADATVRGFAEGDFPRLKKLAANVY